MIMLKSSPANRVAKAETQLTRLVNTMAKGFVPPSVSPFLCGARLIAAHKKAGGLRPIAVGNLTRRLTSKLIAKTVNHRMETLLAPHQLGVGVRGGCEAAVHSIREATALHPGKWVLQLDLENAFNRVSRTHVLSEVATLLPDCLPWAVTCYGKPSFLEFGKYTLKSSSGVQQGDPFASVCFALVLQPVIQAIETEVPSLARVWLVERGERGSDCPDFIHPSADELGNEVGVANGCPQEFYASSLDLLDTTADGMFDPRSKRGRGPDCGLFRLEVKSPLRAIPENNVYHLLQLLR